MKALTFLLIPFLLLIPNKLEYEKEKNLRKEITKNKSVIITAVGDVMLGHRLNDFLKTKSYDWPFQGTARYFKNADIAFCNLEAPLTKSKKRIKKDWNFKADPEAVKVLVYAGIDMVSLANNHILDYSRKGLEETITQLEAHNIRYAGIWNGKKRPPTIIEKNGLKIAFLAYSGVNPPGFGTRRGTAGVIPSLLPYIKQDVKEADSLADIVIVSFHFGKELEKKPNEYQKQRAKTAIDAGADLVLGHHPHTLQPIEYYKDKVIAYSLGNFIFGCYNQIKESAILRIEMSKDKIENLEIIPVNVYNAAVHFQPQPLTGKKRKKAIDFLLQNTK